MHGLALNRLMKPPLSEVEVERRVSNPKWVSEAAESLLMLLLHERLQGVN